MGAEEQNRDQAEKLRSLVNIGNQPAEKPPVSRVITVTSGKGGVGKSNTAINLAIQFSKRGKKVIILDADLGLANIEVMFGTVPKHSLYDVIKNGMDIKDVITPGPLDIGFISGGSGIADMANLSRAELETIVNNLSKLDAMSDVVIIDTGAGISDTVMEFLLSSSEIVLVTTPEPASITDSYSLLKALCRNKHYHPGNSAIRFIGNKVKNEKEGKELFAKLNAVVKRYLEMDINYLGSVPFDNRLEKAVMQQKPVSIGDPEAKSTLAYEMLAASLLGDEVEVRHESRGITALFARMVRFGKRGE
ncbi:MAG: MinD/ParA family protein [Lachnospiraceae bacterium]|nr:MinD/ParA family protein [Lachnospiraceae bacterium]